MKFFLKSTVIGVCPLVLQRLVPCAMVFVQELKSAEDQIFTPMNYNPRSSLES